MKYDGVAATGILLLMFVSSPVVAGSNVEFGGKLYKFRDIESAAGDVNAAASKPKFRPLGGAPGSPAVVGRNIGGADANDQGYVFRPLRNRNRRVPGSEPDQAEEDVYACPVPEDEPRFRTTRPAYSPYQPAAPYPGGLRSPHLTPGGFIPPVPGVTGRPIW
jgi:hypothetical protein